MTLIDLGVFCCCYGLMPLLVTILVLWIIGVLIPRKEDHV